MSKKWGRVFFFVVLPFFAIVSIMVVLVALLTSVTISSQAYRMTSCNASVGPWADVSNVDASLGAKQGQALNPDQQNIVKQIISIGQQRNLPPLAWQIAIQAGRQESTLTNLPGGDRDSVGIFQMRPSMGWGTVQQLQDINYEINKFYDVLVKVPNWQQMRPGDAAQAVERSAFPDAYNAWEAMAAWLIKNIGKVADPSGCGSGSGNNTILAPNKAAATAIAYAKQQLGKPYIWGGNGPEGYDCSGLMQEAYKAAGIQLPRVAADQFHAGSMLPVQQAQPGDLIFLATDVSNPVTIHHVMMYLGGNQVIEAQDFGIPIHIRAFKFTEAEVVPEAVRPGV